MYIFFLDIVFFIFLYQRWIYRVDPTRVNEFGYAAEPIEEQPQAIEEKIQAIEEKPQVVEKDKPKDDKKND